MNNAFEAIEDFISREEVIGLIRRSLQQIRENKDGEYTNKVLTIDEIEKIMIQKIMGLEAKNGNS